MVVLILILHLISPCHIKAKHRYSYSIFADEKANGWGDNRSGPQPAQNRPSSRMQTPDSALIEPFRTLSERSLASPIAPSQAS